MGLVSRKVIDKAFIRQMLLLALPIAFQNLLTTSASLVDTAMITRIGNLPIAAAGIASRWSFLVFQILFGLGTGGSVLFSQYWGVKDIKGIQKTYGISLLVGIGSVSFYMLFCLFIPEKMAAIFTNDPALIHLTADYLRIVGMGIIPQTYAFISGAVRRSTEDVRTPVIGSVVAALTNVFLNWIFIYGNLGAPALGLRGAAIATLISQYAHMTFYIIAGRRENHFTFVSLKTLFCFSGGFFRKFIRVISPAIGNDVLWGIGMNVFAVIYARQSSESYAGYTIFYSLQQFGFIFFVGICAACGIMVGKAVGQGETEEAYALGKRFLVIVPVMGVIVGAFMIAIRNPVLRMMQIETEQAQQVASSLLLFGGLWLGMRNIPYTAIVGILRPGGDTKIGFYMEIVSIYVIAIPVVLIMAFVFKLSVVWLVVCAYLAEDIPKSAVCLWYFKSKRWIRRLTSPVTG